MVDDILALEGMAPPQLEKRFKPKFIEQFYIVELLALASTFYFYVTGHYIFSAFFAFCLGIVLVYFYAKMGDMVGEARGRAPRAKGKNRKMRTLLL